MACGKKDTKSQEVGGRKLTKNFLRTDARNHNFLIIFISFLNIILCLISTVNNFLNRINERQRQPLCSIKQPKEEHQLSNTDLVL